MSNAHSPLDSRIDELLAGRALGDLTAEETMELEGVLSGAPESEHAEFELAAASAAVASLGEWDALPAHLQSSLEQDAEAFFSPKKKDALKRPTTPAKVETAAPKSGLPAREALAWVVALACGLIILLQGWTPPSPSSSLADQRAALLASAEDKIQVAWGPGLHPFQQTVRGDIIWSNSKQQGYMRFDGLPVNDPTVEQYQLWIIDPERDDEPIDGGVFDIAEKGEVIVPIDAKLAVVTPQAFAITIEQPGGVVVSTKERLPLLAKVD